MIFGSTNNRDIIFPTPEKHIYKFYTIDDDGTIEETQFRSSSTFINPRSALGTIKANLLPNIFPNKRLFLINITKSTIEAEVIGSIIWRAGSYTRDRLLLIEQFSDIEQKLTIENVRRKIDLVNKHFRDVVTLHMIPIVTLNRPPRIAEDILPINPILDEIEEYIRY